MATLAQAVASHLPSVYNFCSRMTLDRAEAEKATFETFQRAATGEIPGLDGAQLEQWLLKIAAHVAEKRLPAEPEVDFDLLDDTLRSEATRTHEVSSLTAPEREFLLWELKQGCMTAVINCLSPGERVAFVLSSVIGKSDADAAQLLDIKEGAFKVRLSRARQKVADYLAPRCEHVNPSNPCHCPSRIGVALNKGFIAPPSSGQTVQLRNPRPFSEEPKSHDAVNIFRTLPPQAVPATLVAQLNQAVTSGKWPTIAAGSTTK